MKAMLAAIWTNADWAEVFFLIAAILFIIAMIVKLAKMTVTAPLIEAGLAAIALGFLAL